jgi:hypothetical protein
MNIFNKRCGEIVKLLKSDDSRGLNNLLDGFNGKYGALYMLLAMLRSKEHSHTIVSAIKLMMPDMSDEILYNENSKKEEVPVNTKVFYFRDENKFPVGCAAYTYEIDNFVARVSFGISAHNPEDGFKKDIGRLLAIGRMVEKPTKFSVTVPYIDGKSQSISGLVRSIERIISESATQKGYPTRIRKAAQKHLVFMRVKDNYAEINSGLDRIASRQGFVKHGSSAD